MIDYLQIDDQSHIMIAEGTADDEPSKAEITHAVKQRGYGVENIRVSYDGLQQIWRFTARLINI